MSGSSFYLYHYPLDPPSRRVRLAMAEKGLAWDNAIEKPWEPTPAYLALNPAGEVPTLVIDDAGKQLTISDATAICEYLEETQTGPSLLGGSDAALRAEARRLVVQFEFRMWYEVTSLLLGEKALKRLKGKGEPDSGLIRAGYQNIHVHLEKIGWLIERRNWLAGEVITLADFAAAAQVSILDYLGDVPWDKHPGAKEWYARIKSRPCFRALLTDHIAGFPPSSHYANLDF